MRRVSQQIGWSQEAKLYYEWLLQLERLTAIVGKNIVPVSPAWTFVPGSVSTFPQSSTGYTLYEGAWTNYDDGQTVDTFPLAGDFYYNNLSNNALYLSTNGYIFPPDNSYLIYGDQGDLYLTPGDPLSDGDIQNFWYKNTVSGSKWKSSMLIYCGRFGSQSTPYSYVINLYRDSQYQYIETCCKSNTVGYTGPNSGVVLAQTTSLVWQSPLDGSSWTLLGFGSIQ
jgi:hypothetical protein